MSTAQTLAHLQEKARQEAHDEDVKRWKEIQDLGQQVKAKFEELKWKVERAKGDTETAQQSLRNLEAQLDLHLKNAPKLDEFPDLSKLEKWDKKRTELETLLASTRLACGQLRELWQRISFEAVQVADQLNHLTYAERNMRAKINGEFR